jgi:hypothetical protein
MLGDAKTYDDYADVIRAKEKALEKIFKVPVIRRIQDPNSGNKTIRKAQKSQDGKTSTTIRKEMLARGFNFIDGKDDIEAGHLKVREVLDYKVNDKGEITKQPRYFITENCANSIRHLSRYSREDPLKANGDMKAEPGLTEKWKDFCDLDRYFWMSGPRYTYGMHEFVPELKKAY